MKIPNFPHHYNRKRYVAGYSCIRSSRDNGGFVLARKVDPSLRTAQCAGFDDLSCTWYDDDQCSQLRYLARPPVNSRGQTGCDGVAPGNICVGAKCDPQSPAAWCIASINYLYNGIYDSSPATCPLDGCVVPPSSLSPGAIAGIVIGSLAALCLIGGLFFYFWRRKREILVTDYPHEVPEKIAISQRQVPVASSVEIPPVITISSQVVVPPRRVEVTVSGNETAEPTLDSPISTASVAWTDIVNAPNFTNVSSLYQTTTYAPILIEEIVEPSQTVVMSETIPPNPYDGENILQVTESNQVQLQQSSNSIVSVKEEAVEPVQSIVAPESIFTTNLHVQQQVCREIKPEKIHWEQSSNSEMTSAPEQSLELVGAQFNQPIITDQYARKAMIIWPSLDDQDRILEETQSKMCILFNPGRCKLDIAVDSWVVGKVVDGKNQEASGFYMIFGKIAEIKGSMNDGIILVVDKNVENAGRYEGSLGKFRIKHDVTDFLAFGGGLYTQKVTTHAILSRPYG